MADVYLNWLNLFFLILVADQPVILIDFMVFLAAKFFLSDNKRMSALLVFLLAQLDSAIFCSSVMFSCYVNAAGVFSVDTFSIHQ